MSNHYVLQGGDAGAERLRLLARVKWPTTHALLVRAGLSEGMHCLDVGCGIGAVTLEMARLVGPRGRTVGIDFNHDYIELARQEADRAGLSAEFRAAQATSSLGEADFDLVFARFLLTHLADPLAALERMVRAARPGGTVVVEDIDFAGHFSYPECPALARYVDLYAAVVRHHGGDAGIGPLLPGLCVRAGLQAVRLEMVQPTFLEGEGKRVAAVTMEQIGAAVVAAGVASAAEVAALAAALEEFASAAGTILSMPRIFQVWGRRC